MRIDLLQIAENIRFKEVSDYLMANNLFCIDPKDYEEFKIYLTEVM